MSLISKDSKNYKLDLSVSLCTFSTNSSKTMYVLYAYKNDHFQLFLNELIVASIIGLVLGWDDARPDLKSAPANVSRSLCRPISNVLHNTRCFIPFMYLFIYFLKFSAVPTLTLAHFFGEVGSGVVLRGGRAEYKPVSFFPFFTGFK